MFASSLFVGLFAVASGQLLDQHFQHWDLANRKIKSMIVEFEFKGHYDLRGWLEKSTGSFRLLRTETGELFASYRLESDDPDKRYEGLLNGGVVYMLDAKKESANRFAPYDGDPLRFLSDHVFPFAPLLDRKLAERTLRLDFERQDQWYSYLRINSKVRKSQSLFEPEVFHGVIALMREDTPEIPKYMPRTIRYGNRDEVSTYDIRKWQINPKAAPIRSEFTKPEDRKGWTVKSGLFELPIQPAGRSLMEKY